MKVYRAITDEVVEKMVADDGRPVPSGWFSTPAIALQPKNREKSDAYQAKKKTRGGARMGSAATPAPAVEEEATAETDAA